MLDRMRRWRLVGPLTRRDFRLLWTGQAVSQLGDGIFTVALLWQTLRLSPRPTTLGLMLFARTLPRVLLLILGGAVSDRVSRRRLMLAADVVQGVAVGVIALLGFAGRLELWHLFTLAIVFGAASAFFLPSYTAIVPEVVGPELLLQANALGSSSRMLAAELVGPALGGALVAVVGTSWAFAFDALSFGVSVASLAAMRTGRPARAQPTTMLADVREGFRYTRSQRWLWVTLVVAAVANFVDTGPYVALVPIVVKQRLGAGAGALGLVFAAAGAGAVLTALIAGQAPLPRRRVAVMYVSWAVTGGFLVGIGFGSQVGTVAVLAGGFGASLELGNLLWNTLMQERVPAHVLGRVSSLDWVGSLSLYPISLAVVGPVAAAIGVTATLVGGGLIEIGVLLVGLLSPGVRDPDRLPVPSPGPAGSPSDTTSPES